MQEVNGVSSYRQNKWKTKVCLKNKYLTLKLLRIPCDALIQPHFDYLCPASNPKLKEKMKRKT